MNKSAPVIVWFRQDLRVSDNPALLEAAATGAPLVCIFCLEDGTPGQRPLGGAARWWLHHSLAALREALAARGAILRYFKGPAGEALAALCDATGASTVLWNRRYGHDATQIDAPIKATLRARGLRCDSFGASLLYEPWEVATKAGDPVRVFSPFWRQARAKGEPRAPLPAPIALRDDSNREKLPREVSLADLALLPRTPDWAAGLRATFTPGEAGAQARLRRFVEHGLPHYADNRDRPDLDITSKLSAHLRFGDLSPHQIWHYASDAVAAGTTTAAERHLEKFRAEIGWREFSHHLLHYNPELARQNFQPRFDHFPWRDDAPALHAWQRGQTGYPIVDAGMRELWQTGTMHNRVRMIVASFLIKHLMIDWRQGEAWFWDTLCDADPANNAASWQWVAGSGADAAPYFRVFNPVLQGAKFDPEGAYVRRYVPELAAMAAPHIHTPWQTPPHLLAKAGVRLGTTYPEPIIDLDEGRRRALAAFAALPARDVFVAP